MQIGMIGLGRMGANMVRRLLQGGHDVVVFDREQAAVEAVEGEGAIGSASLAELVQKLEPPRAVWVMIPSGAFVDQVLDDLVPHLAEGDTVIEGGNSFYKDSMERANRLAKEGVQFLDVGVSGGIWGLTAGYCLMIGGLANAFRPLEPIFETLAPPDGYALVGPSGAGHMVKMVHNGIEYGMLQAYAEGFELLHGKTEFDLDLKQIATLWRQGSVVRSWLLDLLGQAMQQDPRLESVGSRVDDSGAGRWTVLEAVEQGVPLPTISAALFARFQSQDHGVFASKVIAALRREFGGHAIYPAAEEGGEPDSEG